MELEEIAEPDRLLEAPEDPADDVTPAWVDAYEL